MPTIFHQSPQKSLASSRMPGATDRGTPRPVLGNAPSNHLNPQPDKSPAPNQNPKRRKNTHRIIHQRLHHPKRKIPRPKKKKESSIRPPIILRPRRHKPHKPNNHPHHP